MYGRNSFELLKAEVLFDELFHDKFNAYVFPAFPGAGGSINDGILDAALTPKLIRPTTFAEISGNTSERAKQFSKILKHSHIPYQQGKRYAYVAALPSCNTTLGLTKKSIIDFHFLSTFFSGSLCLIHIDTVNQFNQHRTV